jgi:hypothetical protein
MASGHGVAKANMAHHPNRQVHPERFRQGIGIASPTPDGGADPRTAGMVIQNQWEDMRDAGMSAQDATARLHGDLSIPMPQRMSDPVVAFIQDTQPRYTNSYGPVADILNARQPTLA